MALLLIIGGSAFFVLTENRVRDKEFKEIREIREFKDVPIIKFIKLPKLPKTSKNSYFIIKPIKN